MTLDEMNKLREAAQAVVDRWYTPKWNWTHDAIGELIAAVRDALAEDQLDEMWVRLAQHQPYADQRGYGPEWARMCEQRTEETAWAAARAADGAADAARARLAWARAADIAAREAAAAAREAAAAAWAAADAVAAWSWVEADEAVRWVKRSEEQK